MSDELKPKRRWYQHSLRSLVMKYIWIVWFIAALIGDELFAYVFLTPEHTTFAISKAWWWIYQGIVFSIVVVVTLGVGRDKS